MTVPKEVWCSTCNYPVGYGFRGIPILCRDCFEEQYPIHGPSEPLTGQAKLISDMLTQIYGERLKKMLADEVISFKRLSV